jgi:hypothetical protein
VNLGLNFKTGKRGQHSAKEQQRQAEISRNWGTDSRAGGPVGHHQVERWPAAAGQFLCAAAFSYSILPGQPARGRQAWRPGVQQRALPAAYSMQSQPTGIPLGKQPAVIQSGG